LTYVPLHVHTINSPHEGMITLQDLVSRAVFLKIPAIAVTDHMSTYGHYEFFQFARSAGIKPLFGTELSHTSLVGMRELYHITALAENDAGYRNLIKLVSTSYRKGKEQYVTSEELAEYREGLIVLTGCLKGEASQSILHGNLGREREVVERLIEIYGEGNLFVEIMNHNLAEERLVFDHLTLLAKRLGVPLVATNNDRYLLKEDSEYYDLLRLMRNRGTETEDEPLAAEFYLKREKEIEPFFYAAGDSIHQAGIIAERCNVDIFKRGRISFNSAQDPDETLQKMCQRRFLLKFHNTPRDDQNRLRLTMKKELECAYREKLSGFLIFLYDLFQIASTRGIWLEIMGGNLLESIIAYLLDIVPLNPVEYDLVLETFSTSHRGIPSSLELMTSEVNKDTVFDLVRELLPRYGPFSQVIQEEMSFQTIAKELIELLGASENVREELARILGSDRKQKSLARMLEGSEPLTHLYNSNGVVRKALHGAQALRGKVCHFNLNSSRLVILPAGVEQMVSFIEASEGERFILCSGSAIEALGGWLLGIQHSHFLSAIDKSVREEVKDAGGAPIMKGNRVNIDRWMPEALDDPLTYALISSGETTGVYLLESRGIRDLLVKIQPGDFSELINVISLYRPAPLEGRLWEKYVENAEKRGKVFLPHHFLAASLESTRGLLLYEEQVREVLAYTAAMECEAALGVENALKSRDSGELLSARLEFIRKAMDKGVDEEDAQKIFDFLLHNISYTHSKALSCSQAYLSYRTAFLKAHRFERYFVSLLNSNMDVRERQRKYIEYLEGRGIGILPTDVNMSGESYEMEGDSIRVPLLGGKSVEAGELQAILEARSRGGAFRSFDDFLNRVYERVSMKTVLELVDDGAFDFIADDREQLAGLCRDFYEGGGKAGFFSAPPVRPAAAKRKKKPDAQLSFFDEDTGERQG
jgi:DNA polymerase-3 subunit alpha